jgi:predicted nucleotidyltransferase component of viral defense system
MSHQVYKKQVALLLSALPYVGEEAAFALHGGTAINLFQQNMPRLSVDIDLTYVPIADRATSLADINQKLSSLKDIISCSLPSVNVVHKKEASKLVINNNDALIKVEVNQIKRGCFTEVQKLVLSEKAQKEFNTFCEVAVVEKGHLYGGKICAALDRQHPRDLFDIKYMLEEEGFSPEIKKGFLFYLISSNRPFVEMLFPKFKDQTQAFSNQFAEMTQEKFDYSDYEQTREELVEAVNSILTDEDKTFLVSIEKGAPDWSKYDFSQFPAVQWKLQNIKTLKEQSPDKYEELYKKLEIEFSNFEKNKNIN